MTSDKQSLTTDVRPDFLKDKNASGVDELTSFIRPAALRIVQKMSAEDVIEAYGVGSVIAVPWMLEIAQKGVEFPVVPIAFFPDWRVWNPRGVDLPNVREITRDRNSEIAQIANDASRRNTQPCPEFPDKTLRYQEHLNYIIALPGVHKAAVFGVSFSRTQHRIGSQWAALIRMREAAIYAGQYSLETVKQSNSEGEWYGWSIKNDGWVSEVEYNAYAELHQQVVKSITDVELDQDDEDPLDGEVVSGGDDAPSF